ncbi:VanZ family protein [Niveibacterium sp. 24ML]|uniref:VanZ family protein n=1 Tax=Niveibacterium sp. 24ML TaxID=2985512 RepID=UPI00226DF4F5|nr:VanZ family protein [Niveibacterium sp. 24ML]MCX9157386.1 VanZ family protein [Niveibacterium sp. 24ML]
MKPKRYHLPRDLAIAVSLLTAYACLHPFSGWHSIGVGPVFFMSAPWPRYFTWLDIGLNIAGFLPLGFAWGTALAGRFKPGRRVVLVWLGGTLLSLGLEILQNYLPTRVASNLDIAANSIGALLGALLALRFGQIFDTGGALARWRERRILSGRTGGFGLLVIGLWWLSLLNPSSYLFANGDLRQLLDITANYTLSGRAFLNVEMALTAANTLAIGLIARHAMRASSPWLAGCILLLGVAVKVLATSVFLVPAQPWHWATPGGLRGLGLGIVLLALAWRLGTHARQSLISLALLAATALMNLAPENPYWDVMTRVRHQGHVLNFHGLTELVGSLWPFFALIWLGFASRRHEAKQ